MLRNCHGLIRTQSPVESASIRTDNDSVDKVDITYVGDGVYRLTCQVIWAGVWTLKVRLPERFFTHRITVVPAEVANTSTLTWDKPRLVIAGTGTLEFIITAKDRYSNTLGSGGDGAALTMTLRQSSGVSTSAALVNNGTIMGMPYSVNDAHNGQYIVTISPGPPHTGLYTLEVRLSDGALITGGGADIGACHEKELNDIKTGMVAARFKASTNGDSCVVTMESGHLQVHRTNIFGLRTTPLLQHSLHAALDVTLPGGEPVRTSKDVPGKHVAFRAGDSTLTLALKSSAECQRLVQLVTVGPMALESSVVLLPFPERRHRFIASLATVSQMTHEIQVARRSVVSDMMEYVPYVPIWRRKWHVRYAGESGIDCGGLARDLESHLIDTLFAPPYFSEDESTGLMRVHNDMKDPSMRPKDWVDIYRMAGLVLARTLLERRPAPMRLAPSLLLVMLRKTPTYADLNTEDPDIVRHHLGPIMEGRGERGATFTHTETYLAPKKGNPYRTVDKTFVLTKRGASRKIKGHELEYQAAFTKYWLYTRQEAALRAFGSGFRSLMPAGWLQLVTTPPELQQIFAEDRFELQDMMDHTAVEGYSRDGRVVGLFWSVVERMNATERRKLLIFATGAGSVPYGGFNAMRPRFMLMRMGGGRDMLPLGRTCSNCIQLPAYETVKQMQEKLLMAIQQTGFQFG